jgi:hypothetical protein
MYELNLKDIVDEDGLVISYYHFEALDDAITDWPWVQGVKLDKDPSEVIELKIDFSDPDAGEFADCIGNYPPMMTAKMRLILDSLGIDNIQYFPVSIQGAERFSEFPTYFAFNVIGSIDVRDTTESRLHFGRQKGMKGQLILSDKLVEAIGNSDIDTLKFAKCGQDR